MASIEREVELALLNAVSGANIPHAYTSERSSGRLLPNVTARASISNELLGPFTGVFSLSTSLIYTSRADNTTRAGFDHEAQTIIQKLYSNPSLPATMTSSSNLTVYKASIVNEGGTIISANRTWQREISLEVQATASKVSIPEVNPTILLHMDGANNSTNFIDSSLNNLSVTANGNSKISTAQYKFGGASGYFDGESESYLQVSNIGLFEFGLNDFTLECWIYITGGIGGTCIARWGGEYNPFFFYADTSQGMVVYINNQFIPEISGGTILSETWHHICLVRSGTELKTFIDGQQNGTTATFVDAINSSDVALCFGGDIYGNTRFTGYIDEARILNNYAAYTSNFTPRTQPFPNP